MVLAFAIAFLLQCLSFFLYCTTFVPDWQEIFFEKVRDGSRYYWGYKLL